MSRPSPSRSGIAALAACFLALSGCAAGGGDDGREGGGQDEAFATVETEFGEVVIEERPERVVALGWGDAEIALQLGVEPVGAADWIGFGEDVDGIGPWVEHTYSESPEILGTMELDYEAVAALEPDLILDVNSSGEQERYERLAAIADTVGVGPGGANYLTTGEEQVRMIGTALGQAERAEEILQEQEEAFAEAAGQHPEWQDLTVSVVTRTSEGWGAYTQDGRVEFMQELGFTLNPEIEALGADGEWSVSLSDEQLSTVDADLIVAFPIFIGEEEITEDPSWNAIPAVAEGRALVITGELSQAFSLGTPEARGYALDQLVPLIEDSLAGQA
ncbi:iron-siderophore ABC transporter substrate-binding protein [Sediminivirga luteola]|uniref:iron-siderophore ABC transporter substrate-binding protein n=1 Tax=Sediminivirga luteola TaxID=1774748 RepID=UPI001F595C7A|nr:iron-siderophore ABC transporter substrate-binding protein [Sediminivirga luteola]MCI2264120.1 iron-siderophore ABC transporter substrate-binding protein [Sediminivirga luteola]